MVLGANELGEGGGEFCISGVFPAEGQQEQQQHCGCRKGCIACGF